MNKIINDDDNYFPLKWEFNRVGAVIKIDNIAFQSLSDENKKKVILNAEKYLKSKIYPTNNLH